MESQLRTLKLEERLLIAYFLMRCNRLSSLVEDQEPRTGGSLINATNEFGHDVLFGEKTNARGKG